MGANAFHDTRVATPFVGLGKNVTCPSHVDFKTTYPGTGELIAAPGVEDQRMDVGIYRTSSARGYARVKLELNFDKVDNRLIHPRIKETVMYCMIEITNAGTLMDAAFSVVGSYL